MILFSPDINPGKFCISFRLPHLQHQCCRTRQQLESEQKRDAKCMFRMVCRSIKMWTLLALAWAGREKCCFLFMTKIIILYVIHVIESTTKYYHEGFCGQHRLIREICCYKWTRQNCSHPRTERYLPNTEERCMEMNSSGHFGWGLESTPVEKEVVEGQDLLVNGRLGVHMCVCLRARTCECVYKEMVGRH